MYKQSDGRFLFYARHHIQFCFSKAISGLIYFMKKKHSIYCKKKSRDFCLRDFVLICCFTWGYVGGADKQDMQTGFVFEFANPR